MSIPVPQWKSEVDSSGPQEIQEESIRSFGVLALPGLVLAAFHRPRALL